MPILNIEEHRKRVMAVICPNPDCCAAPGQLCYETYHNSAGVQTKHTNIFHAERVVKAQTLAERNQDMLRAIQDNLDKLRKGLNPNV